MGRIYPSQTSINPIKKVTYKKLFYLEVTIGDKIIELHRGEDYTILINDFELMFYDIEGLMFRTFTIEAIIEIDYSDWKEYRIRVIFPCDGSYGIKTFTLGEVVNLIEGYIQPIDLSYDWDWDEGNSNSGYDLTFTKK
jgi:hypothetical protein